MHGGGHVGGGHVGGGHVPGGHVPSGHIPGGHVPGGHGHGGLAAHHHHQNHPMPADPVDPGVPLLGLFTGRGGGRSRLRRSDTPLSLHIVRAAVLLAVIGVLLWIGLQ